MRLQSASWLALRSNSGGQQWLGPTLIDVVWDNVEQAAVGSARKLKNINQIGRRLRGWRPIRRGRYVRAALCAAAMRTWRDSCARGRAHAHTISAPGDLIMPMAATTPGSGRPRFGPAHLSVQIFADRTRLRLDLSHRPALAGPTMTGSAARDNGQLGRTFVAARFAGIHRITSCHRGAGRRQSCPEQPSDWWLLLSVDR